MKTNSQIRFIGICAAFVVSCGTGLMYRDQAKKTGRVDERSFFDTARMRPIPVAAYLPLKQVVNNAIVLISHGYGNNAPNSYKGYSHLAWYLAANGFRVFSIQHELPTDDTLIRTGIPKVVRMSNWQRGVANILYVINQLKLEYPGSNFTLIGHSNGGDQSLLFAHLYPGLIERVITLDNRRMDFPRVSSPHIHSLRANEFVPDSGVIPNKTELKQYNMRVVYLKHTKHSEMSDNATPRQQKEINRTILDLLLHD
jgi:hypothetical protein